MIAGLLELVGYVLVVIGIALVYVPAGVVAAGVILILIAQVSPSDHPRTPPVGGQ